MLLMEEIFASHLWPGIHLAFRFMLTFALFSLLLFPISFSQRLVGLSPHQCATRQLSYRPPPLMFPTLHKASWLALSRVGRLLWNVQRFAVKYHFFLYTPDNTAVYDGEKMLHDFSTPGVNMLLESHIAFFCDSSFRISSDLSLQVSAARFI